MAGHLELLDRPDLLGVLHDASVAGEVTHAGRREDGLLCPLLLVRVGLIDHLLSLDERVKVVGDAVVVLSVDNAVDERLEGSGIAKDALSDSIEGLLQRLRDLEVAVSVSMSQILNLLGEMAEEEGLLDSFSLGR